MKHLLFDGGIRGYRTAKDCFLELIGHEFLNIKIKESYTREEIETVRSEGDGWLDIAEAFIDEALLVIDDQVCTLEWDEGDLYVVSIGHYENEEQVES